MKVLQISAIRAIIVLVTGFLLVRYREETMTWMTITVGILFLLSGLVSCIAYYFEKEKVAKKTATSEQQEGQQEEENFKSPSFPIAGVGSIALGIILAVMPNTFITWVVYPCSTTDSRCCQSVYEPRSFTSVRSCSGLYVDLPNSHLGDSHSVD